MSARGPRSYSAILRLSPPLAIIAVLLLSQRESQATWCCPSSRCAPGGFPSSGLPCFARQAD